VALDSDINFIGKKALQKIHEEGIKRIQVGLEISGDPLQGPNTIFWPIQMDGKNIGKVTSAVYSPRLKKNIALAMIDIASNKLGQSVNIVIDENIRTGVVVEKPFYDPKKSLTSS
jgi:aminomethyltransferase